MTNLEIMLKHDILSEKHLHEIARLHDHLRNARIWLSERDLEVGRAALDAARHPHGCPP